MYFTAISGKTPQDAADAVYTFWHDARTAISNQYTIDVQPDVFTIDVATGQPTSSSSTTTLQVTGGTGTDPLPWATQGLVKWTTGTFLFGRQLQGRTFIPGPGEDANTNGVPVSGYKSTLQTAAGNLLSASNAELVVYSRVHKHTEPVSGHIEWSKWAILTSRRD